MMTESTTECLNPNCKFDNALTHFSSGGEVNWVACPKCEKFFDFGVEQEQKDKQFWEQVRKDTGYEPPVTISINPPPSDRCCMCCGRHMNDVKPFGKAGDPLVGDFDGALLLKNYRSMAVPNDWMKGMYKIWDSIEVKYTDFVLANKNFYAKFGDDTLIYLGLRKFFDELKKYYSEDEAYQIFGESVGRDVYDKFRDLNFDYKQFLNRTKDYEKVDEEFRLKCSAEDYEQYNFGDQLCNTIESSWECRDCFILSDEEYHAKIDARYKDESNGK